MQECIRCLFGKKLNRQQSGERSPPLHVSHGSDLLEDKLFLGRCGEDFSNDPDRTLRLKADFKAIGDTLQRDRKFKAAPELGVLGIGRAMHKGENIEAVLVEGAAFRVAREAEDDMELTLAAGICRHGPTPKDQVVASHSLSRLGRLEVPLRDSGVKQVTWDIFNIPFAGTWP